MATVESWFDEFVVWFTSGLRRGDWPNPKTSEGSAWWVLLRKRMVHHGVRRDEAESASQILFDAPPVYLDHVWPELLAAVKCFREAHGPDAPPDDREAARAASRGCSFCGGEGLLSVTHSQGGDPARHCPPTLTAACVCPFGRWHKAAIVKSLAAGRKAGMIDLVAVLNGSSAYRLPIESACWEAAAEAHWDYLSEADREDARSLVRERLIDFVTGHPSWIEGLAKSWAYDPKFTAKVPPPRRDKSWKRATPQYAAGDPGRAPTVARLPGDLPAKKENANP